MKKQVWLKEVVRKVEGLSGCRIAVGNLDGATERLGVRIALLRSAVKAGYSFYHESAPEILAVWDYVWRNSRCYEVMTRPLYYYQNTVDLAKSELETVTRWIERCDRWELSDDLSKIYARAVENSPEVMTPILKVWNGSDNPWKRRQSVVGLIECARKRKRFLPCPELIAFVEPLLTDQDYYVQRGVAWTLREIYNVYPAETLRFFENRAAVIDPGAWSAATEKLDKATRASLNSLRRANRDKSKGPVGRSYHS